MYFSLVRATMLPFKWQSSIQATAKCCGVVGVVNNQSGIVFVVSIVACSTQVIFYKLKN